MYWSSVLLVLTALALGFAECMTGFNSLKVMPSPIAASNLGREIVTSTIPVQLSKRTGQSSDMKQKFEKVVRNAQVSTKIDVDIPNHVATFIWTSYVCA